MLFLGALALLSSAQTISYEAEKVYCFDFPSQRLDISLGSLSEAVERSFLFPYDLVKEKESHPVYGQYNAQQALDLMLRNTGFIGEFSSEKVFLIKPISDSLQENHNGEVNMKKQKGLLSLIIASLVGSAGVQAQNDDRDVTAQVMEEIIVTVGARRTEGRSVLASPVPVDVIGPSDLLNSGITEINDLLARSVPSFNFTQPAVADGTDSVRPAQLRGLAPDHTLVLVNGKRRHASALVNLNGTVGRGSNAVDLNHIPANAIKRIEVLRDGAAAQYGSDAIAGVINIVLKDADEGGSFSVSHGAHVTELDGVPNLDAVSVDANGDLVFDTGGDRSLTDGETTTLRGNWGTRIGDEGFLNISAEYRDRSATNRSDYESRVAYDTINGELDPRELTYDRYNTRYGNPDVQDLNIFVNAAMPLSNGFEIYSHASYGSRDGESGGFNRLPGNSRNIQSIYPDGFLPLIVADVSDMAFSAGYRGQIGEWSSDFSLTYGKNEYGFGVENSLNVSLGPTSQTSFDAGELVNDQLTLNAEFVQQASWSDVPVSLAFGFEYRDESYQIVAGELNSYVDGGFGGATGAQVFSGFQPASEVDRSRNNFAAFGEIDADISDRWNLAFAARYEDFSDFGSTLNGKIASRFDVTEEFSLRGAASTGFRAPSLAQQSFTSVATVFVDAVPTETGTFRPDSDVAIALGSTGLDSEDSTNLSIGFVWTPIDNLSLTVDAYKISIDDRIILTENLGSADVQAVLAAANTQATRARFFFNGVDTETEGVDIVMTYSQELAGGQLSLTAAANFNDTEITDLAPAPAVLDGLDIGTTDNLLFSRREQLRFEEGSPDSKFTLSANWNSNRLGLSARMTRYGEVLDAGTTATNDELLPSEVIFDIDAKYHMTNSMTISLGANNLFDTYPKPTREIDPNPSLFDRIFPYSSFSPFGFSGRYVYGRISYDF